MYTIQVVHGIMHQIIKGKWDLKPYKNDVAIHVH